jgi:hypothetical protein
MRRSFRFDYALFAAIWIWACGSTAGGSAPGQAGTDGGVQLDSGAPGDDSGMRSPEAGTPPEAGARPDGGAPPDAGAASDAAGPHVDGGPPLPSACPAGATCSSCTVSLGASTGTIDSRAVGSCISTYGANIATSAAQRASLKQLGLGRYRIPIRWNKGNPVSSAGGGPQNISADQYVDALNAMGAQVVIVVGGATGDNDFTSSDAANLVAHYGPKGVKTYYLGNEPNNGGISIDAYASLFNQSADAMRAVDSTITIGGPTWSYYDLATFQRFMDLSGSRLDVLDYHHYAMGNPPALSDADALAQTHNWGDEVHAISSALAAKGLSGKQVSVGEYNWAWQYQDGVAGGDNRFFQPIISVWAASVIGHVLSAGGWPFQYSDQNGPLGLTVEAGNTDMGHPGNSPQPIYHGLGMWTGEGLFRSFGTTLVGASCSDASLEIYATSGPNVLFVNKSTQVKNVVLAWNPGGPQAASVWQTSGTDGYAAPTAVARGSVGSPAQVYLALPAMTVTTLVFE